MDKEKEKQTIYDRLVELTEQSKPNKYFSKGAILEYIKESIEEEIGGIFEGSRKVTKSLGGGNFEEIDLDEMLPRQKSMRPLLEELVREKKVQEVTIDYMGTGYRATIFDRSL